MQSRATSPAKPANEVAVQLLVRLPPPVGNVRKEGLQVIAKSGPVEGVALAQALAGEKQAALEPTPITL